MDVGWYRTTIRSFEREIYNIPNSVFSRNVVLNVTRKQREWRFFEFIGKLPPCPSVQKGFTLTHSYFDLVEQWLTPALQKMLEESSSKGTARRTCGSQSVGAHAGVYIEDMHKISMVIADMRKLIRQDPHIIQRLHRRVFLDKITKEQITIYISCYVEAANRDAFMAVKQDLLLAFVECIERNDANLARNRMQVALPFTACLVISAS